MFNPWKVLSKEQLYNEWGHLVPVKHRNIIEDFKTVITNK
ncbi:hypothetical protein HNR27_002811 [Ornithinibacillus bavariensis]